MNKDKVFARRLLKLADYLLTTKVSKQFDFSQYVDHKQWKGKQDLSCGANACALGHAASMPEFRRLGLCLAPVSKTWAVAYVLTKSRLEKGQISGGDIINSIKEIFGTERSEFDFLFLPLQDLDSGQSNKQMKTYGCKSLPKTATAKQVSDRIRFFVKHKYGV